MNRIEKYMALKAQDILLSPIRLISLSIVAFFVWASVAWVDQIVRGQGLVVSFSKPQIIQSLEGGILAEISISEGEIVEMGSVLAKLSSLPYQTQVDDLREQIAVQEIRLLRLEAEMKGLTHFDAKEEHIDLLPHMVRSELQLLAARVKDFSTQKEGAARILEQAQAELDLVEKMRKKNAAPLIEVTRARKVFADARMRFDDIDARFDLERAKHYSDTLTELNSLRQRLRIAVDQLERTTLKAPLRGVVNRVAITTIGGIVRPGEEIMQITPIEEQLFVEARIEPKDVANVRVGQTARIKLSSYDYTIFGSLDGIVTFISADTYRDPTVRDVEPHYKVTVRINSGQDAFSQSKLELRPGMQAIVELQTGQRTILQYLLKPIFRGSEALREA